MATPSLGSPAQAMEGELGHHSPAGSSCVSSEVFGSPIPASPREKLLDSSPSSCVSDDRSKGGRPSSPTRRSSPMGKTLDSPASCVSDGRYVSPLRLSAEQESEARDAEMLLRAIAERYDECFLRLRDATAEVAELRLERLHLRAENMQLSLLLEELEANQGNLAYAVAPTPPPKPAEEVAARGGAPKSIWARQRRSASVFVHLHRLRRQGRMRRRGMVKWRWRRTGRARTRRSCATSGIKAPAPTPTGAGSRTACRRCAPSSATRATRPSPARCLPPPPAAPTATAATSATPQRPPRSPTSPPRPPPPPPTSRFYCRVMPPAPLRPPAVLLSLPAHV